MLAMTACLLLGGVAQADDDDSISQASWNRNRWGVAPLCCPTCPPSPFYSPNSMPSTLPNPNDPNAPPVPNPDLTNPFATATPGGGLQGRSFNETFDGDFSGAYYSKTIVVGYTSHQVVTGVTSNTTTTVTTIVIPPSTTSKGGTFTKTSTSTTFSNLYATVFDPITRVVHVPVAGEYSGVLITDNDSPRPTDRVYFGYNFYSGLGYSLNPGLGSSNENREMIGFEKTFLDGNASIGMRLPFIQLSAPYGLGGQSVGDLSVLFKYAFINDRETGSVASVGLVITTPISSISGTLSDGSPIPNSVLFQPWAGFIRMFDRAYVEGITDLVVPTNGRDTLLWTNSLATGYWIYQNFDDRLLNGIIPTAELHVHTPLDNRNSGGLVYVPDEVNVTAGVHWRFPRATLTTSLSVPIVGPRPYNVEALVNLNFWF
jgi:hypothetical protein